MSRKARKIVVHSPKGGQGKTTLAANLSMMLAAAGRRVLVVDADETESRGLSLYYNVKAERGLGDLLGGTPLNELVGEVRKNLFILPGGDLVHANRIIDQDRAMPNAVVEDHLKKYEDDFDFYVFDTSPNPRTRLIFNLFYYSDQIIIPIETRRAGVDVLENFMDVVVKHLFPRMRKPVGKRPLEVMCIVPYWHTGANASEGCLEILRERYGELLTEPVRQCTTLVEAWAKGAMFKEYLSRKPRGNEEQVLEVFENITNRLLSVSNKAKRGSDAKKQ